MVTLRVFTLRVAALPMAALPMNGRAVRGRAVSAVRGPRSWPRYPSHFAKGDRVCDVDARAMVLLLADMLPMVVPFVVVTVLLTAGHVLLCSAPRRQRRAPGARRRRPRGCGLPHNHGRARRGGPCRRTPGFCRRAGHEAARVRPADPPPAPGRPRAGAARERAVY